MGILWMSRGKTKICVVVEGQQGGRGRGVMLSWREAWDIGGEGTGEEDSGASAWRQKS